MRYWIMDKDGTPQRFPLQRLLRRVRDVAADGLRPCNVLKARGYGARITEIEERLDVEDFVSLPIEELDKLSEGTEEWFYDLEVQLPSVDARFGLHDSTALFVEGAPNLVEEVIKVFAIVRPASDRISVAPGG